MDVDGVCNRLLESGRDGASRDFGSRVRVAPGVWELDLGDQERVFRLTVQEVPRRRLNVRGSVPVGEVDGLAVELTGVVLDTAVTVHLAAAPSRLRDELAVEHAAAFAGWSADPSGPFPDNPAERLMRLRVTVTDDLGTAYTFSHGQAGGDGHAFEAQHAYRPTPSEAARRLLLTLGAPDGPDVRVVLDLPSV